MTRTRVPVRVASRPVPKRAAWFADVPAVAEAVPPIVERERIGGETPAVAPARLEPDRSDPQTEPRETVDKEDLEMWRDRALRFQAERENFCKRQERLADERVTADRERLLLGFLRVADDLERALNNADAADSESLRQGVDLTYQALMRLLDSEGLEPIQAERQPFDPNWHEAMSTVPREQVGAESDTVVKVVETGYRLGDRLLRPARVIVAT